MLKILNKLITITVLISCTISTALAFERGAPHPSPAMRILPPGMQEVAPANSLATEFSLEHSSGSSVTVNNGLVYLALNKEYLYPVDLCNPACPPQFKEKQGQTFFLSFTLKGSYGDKHTVHVQAKSVSVGLNSGYAAPVVFAEEDLSVSTGNNAPLSIFRTCSSSKVGCDSFLLTLTINKPN